MQIKIWLGPIEPKPNTPAYDCHRQDRRSRDQKFRARFCRTFAAFERPQIAMHFSSRRVTLFGIVRACFDQNVVELKQMLAVRSLAQLRIDLWKIEPIFASAGLVKKFAQTVEIGLRCSGTFRRNVTLRTDERLLTARGHQPNIRKLWHALSEDDVGRFDIAIR